MSLVYFDHLFPILQKAISTQEDILRRVAEKMANVIADDHIIYVFGAGHAGIIAEEMFYRAGGLVPVVPIFAPGLVTFTRPATLETELERLSGYATLLLDACKISARDLLIVHSNSGRNTVAIEMAEEAKKRRIPVVALTSVAHSASVSSRHPRGLKLMDIADYVIDNCGVIGDAVVPLEGTDQFSGSTSTVVGAALMNALVVETARALLALGRDAPIFRSANLDGSERSNQRWMDHYSSRLLYL
jgi:uncharacterized phosphosugar-binding protein